MTDRFNKKDYALAVDELKQLRTALKAQGLEAQHWEEDECVGRVSGTLKLGDKSCYLTFWAWHDTDRNFFYSPKPRHGVMYNEPKPYVAISFANGNEKPEEPSFVFKFVLHNGCPAWQAAWSDRDLRDPIGAPHLAELCVSSIDSSPH